MILPIRFQSSNTRRNPVEFDGIKTQAAFFDVVVPTVRKFRIVLSEGSVVRKNRITAAGERNIKCFSISTLSTTMNPTHPPRLSGFGREAQPWRVFYALNKNLQLVVHQLMWTNLGGSDDRASR